MATPCPDLIRRQYGRLCYSHSNWLEKGNDLVKLHSKQPSQGEDQGLAAVCFDACYLRITSYAFTSRMRSQAASIDWTASSNISSDFAIQHQTSCSRYATLFLLHHAPFASLRRPNAPSASSHASTPIPPSARQLGGYIQRKPKNYPTQPPGTWRSRAMPHYNIPLQHHSISAYTRSIN